MWSAHLIQICEIVEPTLLDELLAVTGAVIVPRATAGRERVEHVGGVLSVLVKGLAGLPVQRVVEVESVERRGTGDVRGRMNGPAVVDDHVENEAHATRVQRPREREQIRAGAVVRVDLVPPRRPLQSEGRLT